MARGTASVSANVPLARPQRRRRSRGRISESGRHISIPRRVSDRARPLRRAADFHSGARPDYFVAGRAAHAVDDLDDEPPGRRLHVNPLFAMLAAGDPSVAEVMREAFDPLQLVLLIPGYLVSLALIVGMSYTMYFVLTLPMRRSERVRLFLDLLELGL